MGHYDVYREYATREDFMEKASINGKHLKDIWGTEVENPSYMFY